MRILPTLLFLLLPPAHASAQAAAPVRAQEPIAYRMVRNPVSGTVLPRLTGPLTPQARAVNAQLDTLAASLRCDGPAERGATREFESHAQVTYAANDVFSVRIRASYFCGGPYPTDGANLSVTYDLRTGRMVPWDALFAGYARNGPAIVRIVLPGRFGAAARAPDEMSADCKELFSADELAERGFAYSLSPRGMEVETEFPHAFAACNELTTVPYARVRGYAAPGGILARIARSR